MDLLLPIPDILIAFISFKMSIIVSPEFKTYRETLLLHLTFSGASRSFPHSCSCPAHTCGSPGRGRSGGSWDFPGSHLHTSSLKNGSDTAAPLPSSDSTHAVLGNTWKSWKGKLKLQHLNMDHDQKSLSHF